MLKRLQDWLGAESAPDARADPEQQRLHAVALLMMEAARADFDTSDSEVQAIDAILQRQSGLSAAQAESLRRAAGADLDRSVSLHQTLERINDGFGREQKRALMRSLWEVVYADGRLDPHEEHTVRKLSELLHISHEDFIRTKLAVEEQVQ